MPKYVLSDGRVFTDYHSSSYLNEIVQKKYNVKDSNEYRYFLQKNGTKVKEFLNGCLTDYDTCPVCKQNVKKQ